MPHFAAATCWVAFWGLACAAIPRHARPAIAALPEILSAPTRRPEPGLVEIALEAAPARLSVAGQAAELWTYAGAFPGRLLRVREGETVHLRFANRLPEATNPHFHGLHIPPTGRADNTWLHVPPGETFDYEFTVPPGAGGTHWYHPHVHGGIARQMWAGLAGPLIVDSPLDAMPELAAADERIVVLKDLVLVDGRPAPHGVMDWHKGKEGDLVLVNGVASPELRATAGTVRLRLINACNARYFRLGLEDGRPWHLSRPTGTSSSSRRRSTSSCSCREGAPTSWCRSRVARRSGSVICSMTAGPPISRPSGRS